jgi:hypothetical protein
VQHRSRDTYRNRDSQPMAQSTASASRRRLLGCALVPRAVPIGPGRRPHPLDLAVQDLVGDLGEGVADGAGWDAGEGGAGGVDLGLGGVAGLGEGG